MRYLTISLLFLITSCGPTKTIPAENFKTELTINNLNSPKNKLYVQANNWLVDAFNNPESVIEFTDKEAGVVLGKYLLKGSYSAEFGVSIDTRIFCKIDIRVKDNAAKIIIIPTTNIATYNNTEEESIKMQINNLAENFKKSISTPTIDW